MFEVCSLKIRTGRTNYAKNRHLLTIAQLCRAISSQLRHISIIAKNSLNGNISFIGSHNMMNFGPLTAEICWRVWGTPANFNGFCVLASLLHRRHSTEVTKLCTMFGRLLRWYIIYTFWGLLLRNGILSAAKFTLRQSLASSYTGIHTYILIHIAPKS